MAKKQNKDSENFFLKMNPFLRIGISLLLSCFVFFISPQNVPSLIKVILFWNIFAICYIILCWIVIVKEPISKIKEKAKKEDPSKIYLFIFIIVSSAVAMFTVLLLMLSQADKASHDALYLPASIAGMMLSWFLVHTIYIFHYAHLYYNADEDDPKKDAEGLIFPDGSEAPDYLDFAYFALTIGCTFQVSDVEISSSKIRKVVLFHSLLSYAFNAFVVALTINLVAGLSNN